MTNLVPFQTNKKAYELLEGILKFEWNFINYNS